MKKGKYLHLWEKELPFIISAIKKNYDKKELRCEDFQASGDRVSSGYGFRLDIINGNVPTKNGTAVARDLKQILENCREFKNIAKDKSILIRMGKSFELEVRVDS